MPSVNFEGASAFTVSHCTFGDINGGAVNYNSCDPPTNRVSTNPVTSSSSADVVPHIPLQMRNDVTENHRDRHVQPYHQAAPVPPNYQESNHSLHTLRQYRIPDERRARRAQYLPYSYKVDNFDATFSKSQRPPSWCPGPRPGLIIPQYTEQPSYVGSAPYTSGSSSKIRSSRTEGKWAYMSSEGEPVRVRKGASSRVPRYSLSHLHPRAFTDRSHQY